MEPETQPNSVSPGQRELKKSIFYRFWFWAIIIAVLAGAAILLFVLLAPNTTKNSQNSANQNEQDIKKCIEEAIGKERARAIKGGAQPTEEEQKAIDKCNGNMSTNSKKLSGEELSDDKPIKPSQRITITLPFDINDPPKRINPLGETVEHWEGHPGIDYLYDDKIASFYAMADGEVKRVEDQGEKGFMVCVYSSGYGYCFGHLKSVDPKVKVGTLVKQGQKIGTGTNVHNDFGYVYAGGDWVPDRLCPLTYYSPEQRAILESIPISEKMKAAGFDSVCSGSFKDRHE